MKSAIGLFALIATIFLSSSFTASHSIKGPWVKLGSKKVVYKLDRDVIRVGVYDETFTKLKVAVTGGALNMHKMVVEYGNGSKDIIPLKHNFTP
ncbi:MAG: hypothetical protein HKO56_04505, partial [Bacteroidia bacterium]|nr:hypothetical protein [Bacteroidia bacterium]